MIRAGLAVLFFCSIGACGVQDRDARLQRYLLEELDIPADQMPKVIVVIAEDGCTACNRSFANLVRPRTSTSDCLFLVRAEGRSVDLNGFLTETENIRFDDGGFKELGLLRTSGLIVFRDNVIDTVIALRVEEIDRQLSYTVDLLDSITGSPRSGDHNQP